MKTSLSMKQLLEKIGEKQKIIHTIFEEAGPDLDFSKVKCLGEGDTKAKVERVTALQAEFKDLNDDYRELAAILKVREDADKAAGFRANEDVREDPGKKAKKSFGEMFMEHKGLIMMDGSKGRPIKNNPVVLDVDLKADFFIGTPGWVPEALRTPVVTLYPTRPLAVVERIPTLPTTQNVIRYMKESTFTNTAAEKAEGGAAVEATLVLTETSDEVEKITVYIPVSEEQLEDVPAAEGYLNQRLTFMILQKLDGQVLEGDGNTPNLLGTLNLGSLQAQALSTDPVPDAIYKAFDLVRTVGFAVPSHLFINPNDWQAVRLLRTADGIYIFGNPTEAGPERIWGVPVVQTTAVTANTALVGDYLTHSCLYIRRGVEVEMSNGYEDFFIKGKFAVKATMRCAMVHYRIPAFAKITGI